MAAQPSFDFVFTSAPVLTEFATAAASPRPAASSSLSFFVARGPRATVGGFGLAVTTTFGFFGWMANCPTPPVRSPCANAGSAKSSERHAASGARASA
jgi:hypothetical protein